MSKGEIALASADGYEKSLLAKSVVADFERRKGNIDAQLQAVAKREKGSLGEYRDLLDEVRFDAHVEAMHRTAHAPTLGKGFDPVADRS